MKPQFTALAILLSSLLVLASVDTAQAQWDDMDSGYAVTTEYGHSITAWAGTTDSSVETVEFKWVDPNDNTVWNPTKAVLGPYVNPNTPPDAPQEIISWANKYPGKTVWYAIDREEPIVVGNWLVECIFRVRELIRGRCYHRWWWPTPCNVVPEVPFGTIGILLSMFGVLGTFIIKRKRSLFIGVPT